MVVDADFFGDTSRNFTTEKGLLCYRACYYFVDKFQRTITKLQEGILFSILPPVEKGQRKEYR
jgi:hypothetical protein